MIERKCTSIRRRQANLFHEVPIALVRMQEIEDWFLLKEDDPRQRSR